MTRFDRTRTKIDRARGLRASLTPFEQSVWTGLRGGQIDGVSFRKQHPVGPYVLDFYAPSLKLAVEIDGDSHGAPGGAARDAARCAFLSARGVEVIRFWNAAVRENALGVLEEIGLHVRRRKLEMLDPSLGCGEDPLTPPFQEGEGYALGLNPPLEKGDSDILTPEAFAQAADVSRETLERLLAYDAMLLDWNARHNLVARSTLQDRWRRHFLDSAQLFPLIPEQARTLVDLGSGAGFPGLVLAAMGRERGLRVTLIDSVGKKAAFLSAAAAAMGLDSVQVIPERLETARLSPPDVITARALAPLVKLLSHAHEIGGQSTLCLFLKGQDVGVELTEAAKCWHKDVVLHPSVTSAGSKILAIRNIAPRRGAKA